MILTEYYVLVQALCGKATIHGFCDSDDYDDVDADEVYSETVSMDMQGTNITKQTQDCRSQPVFIILWVVVVLLVVRHIPGSVKRPHYTAELVPGRHDWIIELWPNNIHAIEAAAPDNPVALALALHVACAQGGPRNRWPVATGISSPDIDRR